MQNLYNDLEKLLKDKAEFVVNGKLNKSKISDAAYQYNEALLKILLSQSSLKKQFFMEVGGATVFKQREFLNFLKNKDFLPNSFTEYKNQIGLQDDKGEYYRENKDTVLVFPYKDCILEGGQDKEDQKRNEIFYNETLAPDEITRLFDTKALTNFKLYDGKGEHALNAKTDIDFSKQNLILKGNNLLALHSLKGIKSVAGQVKLIYIDPPYNTGSDSFNYNDKFNHSTWLTFMKNRLSIAKDILRKDGAIFVQIDYKEVSYLNILMDEIFGRENFVQLISVKTASPAGFKTVNPGPIDVTEYILFYTKSKKDFKFKKQFVPIEYDDNYDKVITNPDAKPENWILEPLRDIVYKENGIEIGKSPQASAKNAEKVWGKFWKIIRHQIMAEYALANADKVVSIRDPHKPTDKLKQLLEKSKQTRDKIFVYEKSSKDEEAEADSGYVINGGALSFYSNKIKVIDGTQTPTELLTDFWYDISWDGIGKEGDVKLKNGKKPEKLIKRIIELATDDEQDIVLDFHLGSGTTAAVSHKMNRRYIGIEQLDYEENGSVTRLKNVINGDTTGISQSINWKGGGSFVYAELKRYNQQYIDDIEVTEDSKALKKLYEKMKGEAFFRIEIDHKKWNNDEFEKLTLEEQKQLLCDCLDKNHLYVNLTEMEDAFYKMSKDEIALNKKFYNIS